MKNNLLPRLFPRIFRPMLAGGLIFLLSFPAFAQDYESDPRPHAPLLGHVQPYVPFGAALGPWRWNFDIGGGVAPVLGGSRNQLETGGTFTVGGGYNLEPRQGLVLEYMHSTLGVTPGRLRENGAFDGDAVVQSVTLAPIWRFPIGGPWGGYLIAGGGFYERDEYFVSRETFFVPTSGGGFFAVRHHDQNLVSDAGGVNAGAGLTCNMGWGTKFFIEARYHYVFNGSDATQILPITMGVRW